MTLKELQKHIFQCTSTFLEKGEAHVITDMLIKHFTDYDKLYVNLNPQTEISTIIIERIFRAIEQLAKNEPIQYVLGESVFCGLKFIVNQSVLIPRPETEELCMWVIEENKFANKIIDICTGSGCIAVSLAKNIKNCDVYAVDISPDTLKIANENALLNNVKVNFMQYDIFDSNFMQSIDIKFDVIVSNPPYVREMEKSFMDKRVLDYEPHIALFVEDENPLLFYDTVLKFGQTHLKNNAKLYFEINENLSKEVVALFAKYGYNDIYIKEDIHGKNRMICGRMNLKYNLLN